MSTGHVTAALRAKRVLILLDNCEHVIDVVAVLAETLMASLPNLQIVATSREPLRAAGENIYRVPTLSFPEERPNRSKRKIKA